MPVPVEVVLTVSFTGETAYTLPGAAPAVGGSSSGKEGSEVRQKHRRCKMVVHS
jgi:hypothetical protein